MKNKHEIRTDHLGRKIIGNGPDRTCLDCGTGFSFDTINEDETSPCCGTFRYAGVFWENGISKSVEEWKNDVWSPKTGITSLENFREELNSFMTKNPGYEKDFQREIDFMNLVSPYLKMTKEEMEKAVPNGGYDIGGSGIIAYTGKGGLIQVILNMQKELNKYGKNNN